MGKFGYIAIAMNSEKAWSASAFHPFEEVHGDSLQQMRLQAPADPGARLAKVL